ncbi:CU044_5270 family protein [Streptomyces sp. MST-110588]|uniref:CU044_5270 family protein n=1 Tax=Streptomyces sp. MST-110588 TaxID=2833628 RepID=UPI001F5C2A8A|nr:CU044_5270 family protein [Streptomyces sp. MST-110588]UNO42324.1 CU044_5270 family protein [Streptomyces sp. MST-110588]
MADELELLRQADPAPAHDGPWRDRPLPAHAEDHLNTLLTSTEPSPWPVLKPKPPRGARPRPAPRPRRRRLVLSFGAASAALLAALTFTVSGVGTTPAVAAPSALVPRHDAPPVPLDEIADRARDRARAAGPGAGPRRGAHLQSWSLSMQAGEDAAPPVTVPEESLTRWNPDGSGSELVVATDPLHPGRPVIDDNGGKWRTVNDGKVLHRQHYPPGSAGHGVVSRTKPPTDPTALRAFLASLYGGAETRTPQLLLALSTYLQEWTPGPRERAAVARMLAGTDGLHPVGEVVDRLGRRGQAYVYDGPDGAMDATRHMVILDPDTGAVLGIEVTSTKDLGEFKIKEGDVLSYDAWMR